LVSNDYERTRCADEERSFVVFFGEAAKPAQMVLRDDEKICRAIRSNRECLLGVRATPKAGVTAHTSAPDLGLQPQQVPAGKELGISQRLANVKERHPGIEILG
jgi:hypothetical protein